MSDDEHEQKPKVSITLRTIVTGPEAGCIIGRGGDVVNSIRDESGAKVKIEGSSQQERIITVDGPTDSIFKAYTLICKTLEGRERKDGRDRSRDSRDDDLALNLLVPASQCGAIIGKEGCKIKEIRENTGAAIHVSSESLPGSTERSVKVSGTRDEVTQCIYHICCALLDSPARGETRLYRPDGGFSGGDGRSSRRSDRDSYRRERSPVMSDYGSRSSFEAIAEFARRQRGQMRGGGRREDSRERRRQDETKYEMNVSNDIIGAVIGKRGSKINEIRTLSGAKIDIMEVGQRQRQRDRSPDPDRDRIIEISGTSEQILAAKGMISMAMDTLCISNEGQGRGGRRDERRGRFSRTRSRSRERGGGVYEDRRGRRDKFAPY